MSVICDGKTNVHAFNVINCELGTVMTNDLDFVVALSELQAMIIELLTSFCLSLLQNGQLQQRLDNVQRDFIIFNREK